MIHNLYEIIYDEPPKLWKENVSSEELFNEIKKYTDHIKFKSHYIRMWTEDDDKMCGSSIDYGSHSKFLFWGDLK